MVNIIAKIKTAQNFFQTAYILRSMEDFDHHQSTESGAFIGSNEDLLTEILLRLPFTSILRFRSVSKRWRWLLSQRRFTLLYDSLSKSHGLFIHNLYISFDVKNQSTPFHYFSEYPYGITVMQSCNGLLLCCNHGRKKHTRKYYVLNPTTKQFAIVPSVLGGQDVRKTICFMGLAFDQTHCVHYKVVCVRRIERDGELFQIQMYSSHTRKWKISVASFYAHQLTFERGVYWNGAIHWASSCRKHLCFRIKDGQLRVLLLPVTMVSSVTWAYYFGESRGHLHLIETPHPKNPLQVNVYEMLNDHSGWFVKYQVELDELLGPFLEIIIPMGYALYAVDVVKGENEEDTFMVLVIPGKIVTYNLHDKSFKHISYVGTPKYQMFYHYSKTLAFT